MIVLFIIEIEQLEQDKALLEANCQILEQQIKDAEEVHINIIHALKQSMSSYLYKFSCSYEQE